MEISRASDLHVGFFKAHWNIITRDIQDLILKILNGLVPWQDTNKIDLVLIPKIRNPKQPSNFRPISLCNAIYKVIAQIYSNTISSVVPCLIFENQAGFVKGRLIHDVAMVGIDLLHHIYNRKSTQNMALKLDIVKAFDRINWTYLEFMLQKFNFPASVISIIMKCVTTTSIAIRFNGSITSYFHPSRGLRQGDLYLLYYLFYAGRGFLHYSLEHLRKESGKMSS